MNKFIKRPHQESEYTPQQVQELKRCSEDAVYFIKNYVVIRHPVRGAVPFALFNYQEEIIRTYQYSPATVVLSSRQTGKDLALDTPIATPTGFTTMGQVREGDIVLGGDGRPTTVIWTSEVFMDHKCYEIIFSTGERIVAGADHLWIVNETSSGQERVFTTQEMVDQGVSRPNWQGYNQALFSVNTVTMEGSEQTLPIDPYVLGVWLGDGCKYNGNITSHIKDTELRESVAKKWNITCTPIKNKPNIVNVYLKRFESTIKKLGLYKNKHIPMCYLRSSHSQRLQLLQGLMDTDGHVAKNSNCEISLSDPLLAADVIELVASLGLKPSVKIMKTTHKDSHRIMFTAYKSTHPVFTLSRKLANLKVEPGVRRPFSTRKRSIVSITPTDTVPTKCIGVDNQEHSYCVGRTFIKTHNSECSGAFLLWYSCFHEDKTILIVSNKNSNAMEMISRILFMYEHLPFWLKPGASDQNFNKHELAFDNGSRIVAVATTENSGRGMAISKLFCLGGDEQVNIRDRITLREEWITLSNLYNQLVQRVSVSNSQYNSVKLNTDYQISTPYGWCEFVGIASTETERDALTISLDNNTTVTCGVNHLFFQNKHKISANQIKIGDEIDSVNGPIRAVSIDQKSIEIMYDIVSVDNNHHQFTLKNGLITSNCDEFSFVKKTIQSAFWASISPTLSTGGECIIASTPNGDQDLFSELWRGAEAGTNGFTPIYVPWDAPPGRDEKFMKDQIGKIGKLKFSQEFLCQFISSDSTLINQQILTNLTESVKQIKPFSKIKIKDNPITFWKDVGRGQTYLLSVDPATGTGSDFSVIEVFDFPNLNQICEFRSNRIPTPDLYKTIKSLIVYLNNGGANQVFFTFENNGIGEGLAALYQQDEKAPTAELLSEDNAKRIGFNTNKNKLVTCAKLKDLIEFNRIKINSNDMLRELKSFVKKGASYANQPGGTDDCCTATMLIPRMLEVMSSFDDRAHSLLFNTDTDSEVEEWDLQAKIRKQRAEPEDYDTEDMINVIL